MKQPHKLTHDCDYEEAEIFDLGFNEWLIEQDPFNAIIERRLGFYGLNYHMFLDYIQESNAGTQLIDSLVINVIASSDQEIINQQAAWLRDLFDRWIGSYTNKLKKVYVEEIKDLEYA